MSFGRVSESIVCFLAMVAGFFTAVPLGILEAQIKGTCLLFGELDYLQKNVTSGDARYCNLGFYSSVVSIVLAILLVLFRWCCIVQTDTPSMAPVYGSLIAFTLATLGWINSVVCAVFMIVGLTKWCGSIKNAGLSCKEAGSLEWNLFQPQPLGGLTEFYTYYLMIEISSYVSIVMWFLVAFMSGTQLRQWLNYMTNLHNLYTDHQIQTPSTRELSVFEEEPYNNHELQMSSPQPVNIYEDYYDYPVDYGKTTHL